MPEFILLFRGGKNVQLQSPGNFQEEMKYWMEWMNQIQQSGKFIGAQPLTESGKVISSNKKIVTDGPYMEGNEMVGGYLLCKADHYDEAVEIAKGCPILLSGDGIVEIREIREVKV